MRAPAGEALLHRQLASPRGGPSISLSYFWQPWWRDAAYGPSLYGVMCFRVPRKGESPQEDGGRGVDGKESWSGGKKWGNTSKQTIPLCCFSFGVLMDFCMIYFVLWQLLKPPMLPPPHLSATCTDAVYTNTDLDVPSKRAEHTKMVLIPKTEPLRSRIQS